MISIMDEELTIPMNKKELLTWNIEQYFRFQMCYYD